MDLGIDGRLALVTGASKGIGKAIAFALAEEGARVVVVARSADALEDVRSDLPGDGHLALALDLMVDGAVDELVSFVNDAGALDILVHNLGGSAAVFDPLAPTDDWARVWKFNLGIVHDLDRAFLPSMVERRYGRVVLLSTLSTYTFNGAPAYVSAKCALDGYVKSVSRHVSKDNVIMSAVAPGAIYSEGRHFARLEKEDPAGLQRYFDEHLPINRLGRAEDVAPVVAFLCSEQAAFMAGSIVGVDGGGM